MKKTTIKLAPSILSADFVRLGEDIRNVLDGGIDEDTAPLAIEAGANVLVAGSAIFGKADRHAAIRRLRASL